MSEEADDDGMVSEVTFNQPLRPAGDGIIYDSVSTRLKRIEMKVDLLAKTYFRSGAKVVYVCEPGERLSLIYGTDCAIVVHADRPPKIIMSDGSIEVLSCALK